jgi:hypothetical protein
MPFKGPALTKFNYSRQLAHRFASCSLMLATATPTKLHG